MKHRTNLEIISAVVVTNVSDKNLYIKINQDPTVKDCKEIGKIVTEIKNRKLITGKHYELLKIQSPKAGRFYLLRK